MPQPGAAQRVEHKKLNNMERNSFQSTSPQSSGHLQDTTTFKIQVHIQKREHSTSDDKKEKEGEKEKEGGRKRRRERKKEGGKKERKKARGREGGRRESRERNKGTAISPTTPNAGQPGNCLLKTLKASRIHL